MPYAHAQSLSLTMYLRESWHRKNMSSCFAVGHCSLIEWLSPYSWAFEFQLGALMVVACCLQCDFDFSDSQFQLLPTKGLADRDNRLHLSLTEVLQCFPGQDIRAPSAVCVLSLAWVCTLPLCQSPFGCQLYLPYIAWVSWICQALFLRQVFLLAHAGRLQINFKATGWVPTLELISYFCQLYVKLCASCILILVDSLSLERVRICGTLLVTNIVSEMVCVPGSHWGNCS